jgi:putative hydrolase of the HAD superfamily
MDAGDDGAYLRPMLRYLLLDLDKTIYPPESTLGGEIDRRMTEYVARALAVSPEEAARLRDQSFPHYGSTIRWLMDEHGLVEPDTFLGPTHPEDVAPYLRPDPRVRAALASVHLPMSIFTNATTEHAERVLAFYGVRDMFQRIFDLRSSGYRGKPWPESYRNVLAQLGLPAPAVLFVDDYAGYLRPFRDLGGHVLLVSPDDEDGLPRIRTIAELPDYLRRYPSSQAQSQGAG